MDEPHGSRRQLWSRIGYIALGIATLAAGGFALFAMLLAIAVGMAQSASTNGPNLGIAVAVVAIPAIAIALWALVSAAKVPR